MKNRKKVKKKSCNTRIGCDISKSFEFYSNYFFVLDLNKNHNLSEKILKINCDFLK
jgi:hypothetical protein